MTSGTHLCSIHNAAGGTRAREAKPARVCCDPASVLRSPKVILGALPTEPGHPLPRTTQKPTLGHRQRADCRETHPMAVLNMQVSPTLRKAGVFRQGCTPSRARTVVCQGAAQQQQRQQQEPSSLDRRQALLGLAAVVAAARAAPALAGEGAYWVDADRWPGPCATLQRRRRPSLYHA